MKATPEVTPQETVLEIEMIRKRKNVSITAICRAAKICNSTYSYLMKRGREGQPLCAEQLEKVQKAIKTLRPGAR